MWWNDTQFELLDRYHVTDKLSTKYENIHYVVIVHVWVCEWISVCVRNKQVDLLLFMFNAVSVHVRTNGFMEIVLWTRDFSSRTDICDIFVRVDL